MKWWKNSTKNEKEEENVTVLVVTTKLKETTRRNWKSLRRWNLFFGTVRMFANLLESVCLRKEGNRMVQNILDDFRRVWNILEYHVF